MDATGCNARELQEQNIVEAIPGVKTSAMRVPVAMSVNKGVFMPFGTGTTITSVMSSVTILNLTRDNTTELIANCFVSDRT